MDGLEMTIYYNNTRKCQENLKSLVDNAYFFSKNSTTTNADVKISINADTREIKLAPDLVQALNMTSLISNQVSQSIRYCPVMLYHTGVGLWKHFERFSGQDFTSIAEAFLFESLANSVLFRNSIVVI